LDKPADEDAIPNKTVDLNNKNYKVYVI